MTTQPPGMREDRFEEIDSSIGNYRLLRKIGEGGMGYVYAAEQRSPVRRKVAIKVIKPGMDSREVLARFDAEKQALALMDHPNIARVLDGGAMENGRPYFVMDLVTGLPLTEYCDRHKLGLDDRLELFIQVCQGVQHAHQKAIIHRDLKPSNVVVTVNSGQAIPKVIDFGIAKAVGAELTMKTYYTFAGQVIGTPQYMSPEQAGSEPSDIDTRSDIYSLGVLLDELLTGQTPIASGDLERVGLQEMLRLIREQEGVRPSTQLTRLDRDSAVAVAANRGVGPVRLSNRLRGDLDWIVVKALEKDRSRRYETANALANDVRSFLRNETIQATPPTLRYRIGKVIRRHKGAFVAASCVLLTLVGGLVASMWQAGRASREASRAGEAEAEALANLRVASVERERAQRAQEKAEASLQIASEEREKAERALSNLEASLAREEAGEIRHEDLESRVGRLLGFLRSEPMRIEFQKKDLNGLEVVRSIDEMIGAVFPAASKAGDFLDQDYRLALKLGENAIDSLESSLTAAVGNYRSALEFYHRLSEDDAGPGLIELGTLHLSLAEIAWMRGRYPVARKELESAVGAIAPIVDRPEASALIAGIAVGQAVVSKAMGSGGVGEAAAALERARALPETEACRTTCLLRALALLLDSEAHVDPALLEMARVAVEAARGAEEPTELESAELARVRLLLECRRAEGFADEREESAERDSAVSALLSAVTDLQGIAADSRSRRVRMIELAAELRAAASLELLGQTYDSLQHYQRCLTGSGALLRLDREVARPLELSFLAGVAMGKIYRGAAEHSKCLASFEVAYDALLEAQRRGLDTTHYLAVAPDYFWQMTQATIRQYYAVSNYPSAIEENSFYADEVEYYGKRWSRRKILDDQQRFRVRYPHRIYEVREMTRLPDVAGKLTRARLIIDCWLADPTKENVLNLKAPDQTISQDIGFAFDQSDRLKIVEIGSTPK